jgi:starch-binding outer membrane protein, SusD/RagB family
MYGGVPIFTSVPTVTQAREAVRASREDVIKFVLEDLTAAAEALPNTWPAADHGRATRGAALAYKARAALYEASYQKYHAGNTALANSLFQTSADAAWAVMQSNTYSLHPDFGALFTYAGERSPEVIFDYQRVKGVNGWNAWNWLAPHSMGGNIEVSPTRAAVDNFRMIDGLTIQQSPLYNPAPPVIVDGQVVSLGMYANRDPRFYASVIFPGAQFNGKVFNSFPGGGTDAVVTSNMSNTHTGFVSRKYVDPADQASPFNSGINIILMRHADVLLMYAEAKAELNQADATVTNALNQIRTRAKMPPVNVAPQQLIPLIRNERAVELAFEGLRLADIRRWKIAENVMPGNVSGIDVRSGNQVVTLRGLWQRTFASPRDYLWPIPAPERDLNPNLTQNPGY